jgi:hypothetical protein
MNPIIKQLAEQAGMNIKTNISGVGLVFGTFEGYKTSHVSVEELEKFAELVVKECISFYSPDDSATDWADKMRRMVEL